MHCLFRYSPAWSILQLIATVGGAYGLLFAAVGAANNASKAIPGFANKKKDDLSKQGPAEIEAPPTSGARSQAWNTGH